MADVQILSPEQVRARQMDCFEKGLCFVSLRPMAKDAAVKAIIHPDGYLSMPILVLKEYVK